MNKIQIETAQNVQITQNIAGVGIRILAFIIDGLILTAYEFLSFYIMVKSFFGFSDTVQIWAASMVMGLPLLFYHLTMEVFNNGQSIGKAALKIRVTCLDGTAPRLSHYLLRWIMRIADISLTSGGLAIFVILLNGKGQRLGDLAAQTTVISEKQRYSLKSILLSSQVQNYIPVYPQVTILTDRQIHTIHNLFKTAVKKRDERVIDSLAEKISVLTETEIPANKTHFINQILKDYNYYTQQS